MKKIIIFLLIAIPISIVILLLSINRGLILCPIKYDGDMIIRADYRGNGLFGAGRSGNRLHEGLDLYANVGTPVLAARIGKVIAATQNRGMGKYIVIRHLGGYKTIYGHLSKVCVKKNDFVWRGQVIGEVGKTGNANYKGILPHLHFEIKKDGVPQDPLLYLK